MYPIIIRLILSSSLFIFLISKFTRGQVFFFSASKESDYCLEKNYFLVLIFFNYEFIPLLVLIIFDFRYSFSWGGKSLNRRIDDNVMVMQSNQLNLFLLVSYMHVIYLRTNYALLGPVKFERRVSKFSNFFCQIKWFHSRRFCYIWTIFPAWKIPS